MYRLIESGQDLPARCGIAPMAEEYFRGRASQGTTLVEALEAIDYLLTGSKPDYGCSSDQVN